MRGRLAVLLAAFTLAGCEALVGAGVAGGAYEYQNRRALQDLQSSFEAGEITREEYERRRDEISGSSVIY